MKGPWVQAGVCLHTYTSTYTSLQQPEQGPQQFGSSRQRLKAP